MIDCSRLAQVERCILDAFAKVEFAKLLGVAAPSVRHPKPTFLGKNWWEVGFAEAQTQSYQAFNLSNEEAAYYCPLMMLSCLKANGGGGGGHIDYFERFFYLLDEGNGSWNSDPEFTKSYNQEKLDFRSRFDHKQKAAIACFFHFLASLSNEDAVDALQVYWENFLPDREARR